MPRIELSGGQGLLLGCFNKRGSLTNIKLANTYNPNPNVAAKLNTMFPNIALVKKSPRDNVFLYERIKALERKHERRDGHVDRDDPESEDGKRIALF
jgi:hypothetical protein